MRTTQPFSLTLPNELASVVRDKVAAGEYATESEVMVDCLVVYPPCDMQYGILCHGEGFPYCIRAAVTLMATQDFPCLSLRLRLVL